MILANKWKTPRNPKHISISVLGVHIVTLAPSTGLTGQDVTCFKIDLVKKESFSFAPHHGILLTLKNAPDYGWSSREPPFMIRILNNRNFNYCTGHTGHTKRDVHSGPVLSSFMQKPLRASIINLSFWHYPLRSSIQKSFCLLSYKCKICCLYLVLKLI